MMRLYHSVRLYAVRTTASSLALPQQLHLMTLIASHQKTVKQFDLENVIPANNAKSKEAYNYTALLLFDIRQNATPETCGSETFSSPITADVVAYRSASLVLETTSHTIFLSLISLFCAEEVALGHSQSHIPRYPSAAVEAISRMSKTNREKPRTSSAVHEASDTGYDVIQENEDLGRLGDWETGRLRAWVYRLRMMIQDHRWLSKEEDWPISHTNEFCGKPELDHEPNPPKP
ncbi:hypothetical protein M441DRAFT_42962 [Trichoderma asperellum CBS 433.97]|uniref:Uncharacterized protein n=1 Tax=Trichoderma asperellum (strain ATCC 204424 / CBS 433.97 / NBRC 101777) TaxID=1042311 RepID=A0A2T3ZJ56_TRIA4|nr:hypothetical protein M441DRAFT_42962 [Trichoderma asperellum CBS 433.97]PTB44812.1 hypothetical protein M441DRAFT_42962 [Trichoderma asperellum CBS 433.97]